jgi:hypothetical protein
MGPSHGFPAAHSPINRRDMLRRLCGGFGMVGLAGLLGPQMLAAPDGVRAPHFKPRAKRVIFLFMNGGPSHLDTFDPKPALMTHAGQQPEGELYKKNKGSGYMPSPLTFAKHGKSGIEVSETLPNLARVIDDCCVIRSMRTDEHRQRPAHPAIDGFVGALRPRHGE